MDLLQKMVRTHMESLFDVMDFFEIEKEYAPKSKIVKALL